MIVSVVIPVYNGMPYLPNTIESILNQTYKDFELIIVNDGSSDDSEEYLKSLKDDRIVYFSNKNQGLCNSINYAFSKAKGKYVFRNDQDDVSYLNRIERQVDIMEKSDFDCVFSFIDKISGKKVWKNLDKTLDNVGTVKLFNPWNDGCMLNSTMAIKKDVFLDLGGYRGAYYPSDDWDLELRLTQKYKVGIIQESLLKYRFHESANTYKYWDLMQNTRRWAESSYFKREEGKEELSFEDFLKDERKHILKFLNRRRKDKAKLFLRKSGGAYLNNEKFKMLIYVTLSSFFDPLSIIRRFSKFLINSMK